MEVSELSRVADAAQGPADADASADADAARYAAEPGRDVLGLYSLAVEMADRVSARRGSANVYFLSIQTTLLTAAGVAYSTLPTVSWYFVLVTGAAGCTISLAWWRQLRSYQQLNEAKFRVINETEKHLPLRLFGDEWASLKDMPRPQAGGYAELGAAERAVPWMFAVLHILLLIGKLAG
jgi:hypothetical protein